MRLTLIPGFILATLLAGPALGQQAAPADCRALVKSVVEFEKRPDMRVEDIPGGCRATNVVFRASEYVRYSAAEVTLKVPDLLAVWPLGEVFTEAELTVIGVRIAPDTGSPLQNYIVEMQALPFDIHLAYRWDREKQTLDMPDFSVQIPGRGGIAASGHLSSVPSMVLDSYDIADFAASLDQLTIRLDNPDMFNSFLAIPMVTLLPTDADPRPQIAAYQHSATAAIEALPDDRVSPESKATLTRFIASFPRPDGDYTFDISANPPLPLAALDIPDFGQLGGLLARLTLAASVTPEAD